MKIQFNFGYDIGEKLKNLILFNNFEENYFLNDNLKIVYHLLCKVVKLQDMKEK